MVLTALLMLPVIYYLAVLLLPAHFRLEGVRLNEDGIQAEIHGTPFKAGGLESSGSPNHPEMFGSLAQFLRLQNCVFYQILPHLWPTPKIIHQTHPRVSGTAQAGV